MIESGKTGNVFPYAPVGSMEDMRAVSVDPDAVDLDIVYVSGNMRAFLQDKAAFALFRQPLSDRRPSETGADHHRVILPSACSPHARKSPHIIPTVSSGDFSDTFWTRCCIAAFPLAKPSFRQWKDAFKLQ
jgi:hypothetical protein